MSENTNNKKQQPQQLSKQGKKGGGGKGDNKHKQQNMSKKAAIKIPPPLVQVDFGSGPRAVEKKTKSPNTSHAKLHEPAKEKLSVHKQKASNGSSKNYQHISLPNGQAPDFGNGSKSKSQKRKSKEASSADLLNLLRGDSKATTISPESAYAGNSFTYSSPSLVSLPKPTF